MRCAWQVEIDDYATRVLTKHWPDVPKLRDVREAGRHNLGAVDLICGGFPCQPHSLAGQRRASADERDLWSEFARIIGEVKPRWVLAENVPGVRSSENGAFFGRVLRDLAACGYDAEWDCIPAAAIGAPHYRDRLFIVGHANGKRWAARRNDHSTNDREISGATGEYSKPVADTASQRCDEMVKPIFGRAQTQGSGGAFADSSIARWREWWAVEPSVGRVAHGVPARVDRLRGLGNAVVPQVAELIGRYIVAMDAERRPQTLFEATQQRVAALGGHLVQYLGVDDLALRLPGQRKAYRVSLEQALRVVEKLETHHG